MTDTTIFPSRTGRDLPTKFATQANFLGAAVVSTHLGALAAELGNLVGETASGVAISSDLLRLIPELGGLGQSSSDHPAVVVSRAHLGVAATGSVLIAEESTEDRHLHILARRHIVLLPATRIVCEMSEAAGVLRDLHGRGIRFLTFVSGPSRTADIEKILTIGVHGPHELVVVIVDGWEPDADTTVS